MRKSYLAYVASREFVGERFEKKPLVLACKFICCVHLNIAFGTQRRLVGATYHRRRSFLTHIALNFHLQIKIFGFSRSRSELASSWGGAFSFFFFFCLIFVVVLVMIRILHIKIEIKRIKNVDKLCGEEQKTGSVGAHQFTSCGCRATRTLHGS